MLDMKLRYQSETSLNAQAAAGLAAFLSGGATGSPATGTGSAPSTGDGTAPSTGTGTAPSTGTGTTPSTDPTKLPDLPGNVVPGTAAEDPYFPANPGHAKIPSPENSRIIRVAGKGAGDPYVFDEDGTMYEMEEWTPGCGKMGVLINGASYAAASWDPEGHYNVIMVRQKRVYFQRNGGQWQEFRPAQGGFYNAGDLPDALTAAAAAPGAAPTLPALPPRSAIAAGSSGRIVPAAPGGVVAAIEASLPGDTVIFAQGRYNEVVPKLDKPLKLILTGAVFDFTGLTDKLAYGKAGFSPSTDCIIVDGEITGVAMDQDPQNTCGIRVSDGCGYLSVTGTKLYGNQCGIGSGGFACVIELTNVDVSNNGLPASKDPGGLTHNMYFGGTTNRVTLTDVISDGTNGYGHALKSRAFETIVKGGRYVGGDQSTTMDFPDGSATPVVLSDTFVGKVKDAANHGLIGYAMESKRNGNTGVIMTGGQIDAPLDSPTLQGSSNVVFALAGVKQTGNKLTGEGCTITGLAA